MDNTLKMNAPEEYLENFVSKTPQFTGNVKDIDKAAQLATSYVEERLKAIAKTYPHPLVFMLSGGIDSLLTLTIGAKLGIVSQTITFHWHGSEESTEETTIAKEAAHILGIDHIVVSPSENELRSLLQATSKRLGTTEPWEVLAGMILYAVAQQADKLSPQAALISSAGADSLFLGGKQFTPTGDEQKDVQRWAAQVMDNVESTFRYGRFIPDFYERILNNADRHFKIWQTEKAVHLTSTIHPRAVKGQEWAGDKLLLRQAALQLGMPKTLLNRQKSPMQVSSGGIKALEDLARWELSREFKGRTYSDPQTEDISFTLARLYLEKLAL